eukprot:1196180-Prorocentrum_minimum.AAC.3
MANSDRAVHLSHPHIATNTAANNSASATFADGFCTLVIDVALNSPYRSLTNCACTSHLMLVERSSAPTRS